jgi:hypothetical protein
LLSALLLFEFSQEVPIIIIIIGKMVRILLAE